MADAKAVEMQSEISDGLRRVRVGDRVHTAEDPTYFGVVVERYSGPKPAMRGMLMVDWGHDEWTWEYPGDLRIASEKGIVNPEGDAPISEPLTEAEQDLEDLSVRNNERIDP